MPKYEPYSYPRTVGHSIDVLFNAALGGLRRQTYSARLGLYARRQPDGRPARGDLFGLARVSHTLLEYWWPGHCEKSAQDDDAIGDNR